MSYLLLGPIVGHTDHASTRIWIRVHDSPADYTLRIRGHGVFPFVSTEAQPDKPEFGTALAKVDGMRSDWEYRYQILRRSRVVSQSDGMFRTMPDPASRADMLFVSVSCSDVKEPGAWGLLDQYVRSAKPRFVIMMGDQVYLDDDDGVAASVWPGQLGSDARSRRHAIIAKYQEHWSREPIRSILANTPCYMMWDDHEIRNGWGSYAPDSPTLAEQFPRGAKITARYNDYFEDCREVYWHFQGCRNPQPPDSLGLPPPGTRVGMPFCFRCGRLFVLVLDDRGARDIWRPNNPVLGDEQWKFLQGVFQGLAADIDALAVVVPLPLTSMSANGVAQNIYGRRTDDIELFQAGDDQGLRDLLNADGKGFLDTIRTVEGGLFGENIGSFKMSDLTDIRDNWVHAFCRPEQEALIRAAAAARLTNRLASQPRSLVLVGGDLHAGGLFELSVSDPECSVSSLVTSGISKQAGKDGSIVGLLMDEEFDVADGIHAKLQKFTGLFNFGVTQILFGGNTAVINNAVAHAGETGYLTIRLGGPQDAMVPHGG